MQRAPIVLSATAAGLAGTLAFHAHAPAVKPAAASGAAATTSRATTSSATTSAPSTTTKTVTGDVEANQYGDVQLKLTVAGSRITAIEAVQLPESDPRSAQISAYAEPLLRRSALAAQSASIDAVSGATYTSQSYDAALQSALDKAGISGATS